MKVLIINIISCCIIVFGYLNTISAQGLSTTNKSSVVKTEFEQSKNKSTIITPAVEKASIKANIQKIRVEISGLMNDPKGYDKAYFDKLRNSLAINRERLIRLEKEIKIE